MEEEYNNDSTYKLLDSFLSYFIFTAMVKDKYRSNHVNPDIINVKKVCILSKTIEKGVYYPYESKVVFGIKDIICKINHLQGVVSHIKIGEMKIVINNQKMLIVFELSKVLIKSEIFNKEISDWNNVDIIVYEDKLNSSLSEEIHEFVSSIKL